MFLKSFPKTFPDLLFRPVEIVLRQQHCGHVAVSECQGIVAFQLLEQGNGLPVSSQRTVQLTLGLMQGTDVDVQGGHHFLIRIPFRLAQGQAVVFEGLRHVPLHVFHGREVGVRGGEVRRVSDLQADGETLLHQAHCLIHVALLISKYTHSVAYGRLDGPITDRTGMTQPHLPVVKGTIAHVHHAVTAPEIGTCMGLAAREALLITRIPHNTAVREDQGPHCLLLSCRTMEQGGKVDHDAQAIRIRGCAPQDDSQGIHRPFVVVLTDQR